MKTFLSVFMAILTAVAVIASCWFAYVPIGNYEAAKRECMAAKRCALDAGKYATTSDEYRLAQLESSMSQLRRADDVLAKVLASKPYGMALSSDEKNLLSGIKARKRKYAAGRIKASMEVYKVYHDEYPTGTTAEIVSAIEGDLNSSVCFLESGASKNSAGEIIDPFGNPYPMNTEELAKISEGNP